MNEHASNVISEKLEVEIEERSDTPGVWTVEAIGSDGEIYQALFAGPSAHERATEYAAFKYPPNNPPQ